VLVIAQAEDGTADLVIDALRARGADVARIDTADFPSAFSLAATPDRTDSPGWFRVPGRRIDLERVCSVYRRHPARFVFPEGMSAPERRFATLESVSGLGGVLSAQPWRWIDHPGAVADASYKPRQLRVAAQCGLSVPRSLVTNVGARAREFAAEVDWRARYDELRYEVCETPGEVRCGVRAYLREFKLVFGAFDFSVTPDGRWWFLECNPAGQWGWIAEQTGLPIAEAIADELVGTP
jgi:hypothetical protein